MSMDSGASVLFIAVIVFAWCRLLLDLIRLVRVFGWEQTTGRILLRSSTMHDGQEYVRNYLHYSYRVGDTEYFHHEMGHGVGRQWLRPLWWTVSILFLGRHPEVNVRYRRDDPQKSVILAWVPVRLIAIFLGMTFVLYLLLPSFLRALGF